MKYDPPSWQFWQLDHVDILVLTFSTIVSGLAVVIISAPSRWHSLTPTLTRCQQILQQIFSFQIRTDILLLKYYYFQKYFNKNFATQRVNRTVPEVCHGWWKLLQTWGSCGELLQISYNHSTTHHCWANLEKITLGRVWVSLSRKIFFYVKHFAA